MKKNILGHQYITNRELPLLAAVINEHEKSKEKTLDQLKLIDDLLGVQKIELLLTTPKYTKSGMLRKNQQRTLLSFIEDRIDIEL